MEIPFAHTTQSGDGALAEKAPNQEPEVPMSASALIFSQSEQLRLIFAQAFEDARWSTIVTGDMPTALQALIEKAPSFVIIGADFSQDEVEAGRVLARTAIDRRIEFTHVPVAGSGRPGVAKAFAMVRHITEPT